MNILVTGSSGFLGKKICEILKQKNYNVFEYDICNNYDILNNVQLEKVFCDFKPTTIIHLAACADLNIFSKYPKVSYDINVKGTRNILNLCCKYNARLLFASTCCCYGNNNTHPTDETSPTYPTEPYAESKKISENEILKVGLPHCCMRLATFYGPQMRSALAPAIFLDKAHKQEQIEIHGSGEQTRTMTYVDDIVSGIITILENKPIYTIINITTEEETSVNQMIDCAKLITNNNIKSIHIDDRIGQIKKEVILSKRLQSFGWKPKTLFKDGMKKSYEYYLKNKFKFD